MFSPLHRVRLLLPALAVTSLAAFALATRAQVPPASSGVVPVSRYLDRRPELRTFLYPGATGFLGGEPQFGRRSITNWRYRTPDDFASVCAFYAGRCAPRWPLQGTPKNWFSNPLPSQMRSGGITTKGEGFTAGFDNTITDAASRSTIFRCTNKYMVTVFVSRAQNEAHTDISVVVTDL